MLPTMTTIAGQVIGSAEACSILGVDRSTLVRMVQAGRLVAATKLPGPSGAYLFDRETVEQLAEQRAAS